MVAGRAGDRVAKVNDDVVARLPSVDPAEAHRPHPTTLSPELLAGLLADGDDELAAWVLRDALTDRPRAEVYDGLLRDAMTLVGERWATGQWTVAEEHLASQTLLRALDAVRPNLGPERRVGPLAVLAGVAGEHHMIGLVCLDHVLQETGWTVADLGADVPTDDLAGFVGRNEVALVALAASDPARALGRRRGRRGRPRRATGRATTAGHRRWSGGRRPGGAWPVSMSSSPASRWSRPGPSHARWPASTGLSDRGSDRDGLAVLAEDGPEHAADLAERGVGGGAVDERWHEVRLRRAGSGGQRAKPGAAPPRPPDRLARAGSARAGRAASGATPRRPGGAGSRGPRRDRRSG